MSKGSNYLSGAVTKPSPHPPGLSSVLERNIATLKDRRRRDERDSTLQERVAEIVTRFAGSMLFVYLHLGLFGFWIIANLGWIPGVPKWDESFVILAMWASVEAIFLSTFVLISQNRMQAAADKRADLDLQISLLTEHEITKVATLVAAIGDKLGVRSEVDDELDEITQDIAPEAVLDEIEADTPGKLHGRPPQHLGSPACTPTTLKPGSHCTTPSTVGAGTPLARHTIAPRRSPEP